MTHKEVLASSKTEHSVWLLIYTKAREEQRAKKNLENQGFETFLPMIAHEKKQSLEISSLEVMFPRYLFSKFTKEQDNWNLIRSTRGVSHLVFFGEKHAEVPNHLITLLKSRADENDIFLQRVTKREFQKGEKLVVRTGVFEGMEATFLSKSSKQRVRILLNAMNQLINADLPTSDVGEKEIIEALTI